MYLGVIKMIILHKGNIYILKKMGKSNILSQLSNVGSIKKEIISLLIVFFSFVWGGSERKEILLKVIISYQKMIERSTFCHDDRENISHSIAFFSFPTHPTQRKKILSKVI